MDKKGPLETLDIAAQVVNGVCPTCTAESIFVSIYKTIFRCTTCGSDIEQKINGKISYIPVMSSLDKDKIKLELNTDGQEG